MKTTYKTNDLVDENILHKDIHREVERVIEGNPYSEYEDIEVTITAGVNTEQRVNLVKLNRVPASYVVVKKDRACDIYSGTTTNVKNQLYIKSTVNSAVITLRVT